jgi:hypothetical protein
VIDFLSLFYELNLCLQANIIRHYHRAGLGHRVPHQAKFFMAYFSGHSEAHFRLAVRILYSSIPIDSSAS